MLQHNETLKFTELYLKVHNW